ncbi:MAG: ricin-type beta-trefoil lectin domain protein [Steroidobacteraceae bacterium]
MSHQSSLPPPVSMTMPGAGFRRSAAGRGPFVARLRAAGLIVALQALLVFGAGIAQPARADVLLAATPPMGWNDWAHYQCRFDANTILANARALVKSGLAARGYDTVTIDDCWMRKARDGHGNLQANTHKFPHGIAPVAAAIHALGLKFGIYEDAGYATCGGFAGSGVPNGGGAAHFLADARLFASWGVDYLKLDGCNVYTPKGESANAAYRSAYHEESLALKQVGRPIVFSESAPAYFQGKPQWYDVLSWVRGYGQLWREGSDIEIFDPRQPDRSRWASMMWNYEYNLPLGRFQKPGNWNDADFIIGGDRGTTLAETRSQLALWAMMSAPLILSSNLDKLSAASIRVLSNRAVLAVDQDPLGRMATLLRRSPTQDWLLKPLQGGRYAVAVLNRGTAAIHVQLRPTSLGFAGAACRFEAVDLWSGTRTAGAQSLAAAIGAHDTQIWTIRPTAACGTAARVGVISRIRPSIPRSERTAAAYTRCLTAPGSLGECTGGAAQRWQVASDGALNSGGRCLTQVGGHARLAACRAAAAQHWRYSLLGNLINQSSRQCLTGRSNGPLSVAACGHNLPSQVWSVPAPLDSQRPLR